MSCRNEQGCLSLLLRRDIGYLMVTLRNVPVEHTTTQRRPCSGGGGGGGAQGGQWPPDERPSARNTSHPLHQLRQRADRNKTFYESMYSQSITGFVRIGNLLNAAQPKVGRLTSHVKARAYAGGGGGGMWGGGGGGGGSGAFGRLLLGVRLRHTRRLRKQEAMLFIEKYGLRTWFRNDQYCQPVHVVCLIKYTCRHPNLLSRVLFKQIMRWCSATDVFVRNSMSSHGELWRKLTIRKRVMYLCIK